MIVTTTKIEKRVWFTHEGGWEAKIKVTTYMKLRARFQKTRAEKEKARLWKSKVGRGRGGLGRGTGEHDKVKEQGSRLIFPAHLPLPFAANCVLDTTFCEVSPCSGYLVP